MENSKLMKKNNLFWISQIVNDKYYIKILDRTDYRILVELFLDETLYEIFKKIMLFDNTMIQYIEHPIVGEASKVKLRQSPHHKIKSLEDLEKSEQEFYLGP